MKKLIILDRDGVINEDSKNFIKSPEEWHPIAFSLEAIALLNRAGFTVAVASNQSGIGRGYFDLTMLNLIHDKMTAALMQVGGHIDKIVFCPHLPDDHCTCRKPGTGLLEHLETHYQMRFKDVPMIGDSLRDIEAAEKISGKAILVLTGNGKKTLEQLTHPIPTFNNLYEAAAFLISKEKIS